MLDIAIPAIVRQAAITIVIAGIDNRLAILTEADRVMDIVISETDTVIDRIPIRITDRTIGITTTDIKDQ